MTSVLAQPSLKSRRDFAVGNHPVAAIGADFDGDGNLDIITANQLTNNTGDVSLMKGFGDGTFRRVASINAGLLPSAVAFADATGDGRPDLLVASFQSQEVTVHPGDGLGGFGPKISTLVSGRPSGLAVGDWNRDGKLDIATVNDANISTMLGDGTGRFGTLRQFTAGTAPRQILAADFSLDTNGTSDGILDLAVLNNGSNNIQIFRGDGAGLFTLTRTLTTGTGPLSMTVGQFTAADSRLDVAVANYGADTVGIFLANATGGFGAQTTLSTGLGPWSLAQGDLNLDGNIDLIVGQAKLAGAGEVVVLTGNGLGGFAIQPIVHSGPDPSVVVSGDFNRDGYVDAAALSRTGDIVSVLQNVGAMPLFVDASKITLPLSSYPQGVAVADFNRDGKVDVIAADQGLDRVSVTLGDGLCGFGTVNSSIVTGISPSGILVADFTRDGCPDAITPNNSDDTLSFLRSNCAGGFTVTSLPAGCVGAVAASSGDLNADLDNDVAVVCDISDEICTRRGTGTGTFGVPVCTTVTRVPGGVAIGRYNLDVFEDAAVTSTVLGVVATCISDGAGGCIGSPPATFQVGPGAKGIARRDINGDGFNDLVVANNGSNTISALIGDGGGIFYYPPIDSVVGLAPTAVVLEDFNLDGKIDAAVANGNANNVSLMLGDGLGHFTKAGDYGVRALPAAIAAGDCNGDGKPDLMVADNFDNSVTILLNQSSPGDPLQMLTAEFGSRTLLRWGIVPGGTYDVIRGQVRSVVQGPASFNLGPVTCMANDLVENDTASYTDGTAPPLGDAYFYLVRSTVGAATGQYTVSTNGKPGIPASGGCP